MLLSVYALNCTMVPLVEWCVDGLLTRAIGSVCAVPGGCLDFPVVESKLAYSMKIEVILSAGIWFYDVMKAALTTRRARRAARVLSVFGVQRPLMTAMILYDTFAA